MPQHMCHSTAQHTLHLALSCHTHSALYTLHSTLFIIDCWFSNVLSVTDCLAVVGVRQCRVDGRDFASWLGDATTALAAAVAHCVASLPSFL